MLISMMTNRSDDVMSHQRFQQFLQSGQKFDLVVFGWFMNDYMLGVAGHFRCPSVIISTIPALKSLRDYVGNPTGVSSVPFYPRQNPEQRMSFFGRVINFIVYALEFLVSNLIYWFLYEPQYEKHFPVSQNYPSFEEVQRNVSLILVNNHFSHGGVRPLLPNVVEVGGIQIKDKPDPLELVKYYHANLYLHLVVNDIYRFYNFIFQDLQNFLDSAGDHGAILFSLGSNAKLKNVNSEKLAILFSVFAKLKQKIVMKFETDEIPAGKPSNVLTRKWLPQDDILAHPNVRLFISHCGLSSVNEAKYHGVPVLGVPLWGDQLYNIKHIASQGWAVELPFEDITEATLTNALNEILSNGTYLENVKRISLLYRDRPMSALDTAVFWVEYVLRHNGGRHMQSEAVHLNFFQKQSLDVLAFLIAAVVIGWKLTVFIIKKIVRRLRSQKKIKIK